MGKINLLDLSVANLIAAGEVVDRPASVIKELMENSIDASATELTIEIKNGGTTLMRVSDNGCGMSRDDATLCISRHATSKIRQAKDLDGIITLGFRGEALAAIASVSRLRIMTRREEDLTGTIVTVDCGTIVDVSDAGCRKGTTIVVEELFRNVPARRKFLKKDASEAMAITAVVEKIALSRPDIAFRFISDNQPRITTTGDGKLYNAIYAVLGRDFTKRLIPVHNITDGIEVSGYIGRPDNVRANRNYQNFFINGRYVKSRTAAAALEQAFSSFLETERFPCCILGITIHPSFVDVNVHPTKLEVKFSNERVVFDAIYAAVRNSLISDKTRPEITLQEHSTIPQASTTVSVKKSATYPGFAPVYDRSLGKEAAPEQMDFHQVHRDSTAEKIRLASEENRRMAGFKTADMTVPTIATAKENIPFYFHNECSPTTIADVYMARPPLSKKAEPEENVCDRSFTQVNPIPAYDTSTCPISGRSEKPEESLVNNSSEEPVFIPESLPKETTKTVETDPKLPNGNLSEEIPFFKLLGIAFETYILVELDKKLLLIDKHAAHERILFEQMKENIAKGEGRYAQMLLIPKEVPLSPEERAIAEEFKDSISAVGYNFSFNENSAKLTALPGGLDPETATDLFAEMVSQLQHGTGNIDVAKQIAFEKALYQASCKAAVKGGRRDDAVHLEYIVKQLLKIPNLRYCPHGRPVAFEISKASIEHQFKRT